MADFYGWAGTILNIDLTTGRVEREPLDPAFARKYLGASGFNAARLFELVKPEVDALSPQNVLMFGVGTLAGTLAPGSARLTVTAKSPLTDVFGDSNMGGNWSTELKLAGYDQLVFSGRADHPVYLWIADDKVELRDASHLWGKSTWDTARMIKEEIGDPFVEVVCIGPAGEKLVRFAAIICPTKRAAGRTGMGAVMGSKNLKAIAVRGATGVAVARPDEFLRTCKQITETIKERNPSYRSLQEYGTPGFMHSIGAQGAISVRNLQKNTFSNWEALTGRTLKRDYYRSMRACATCPVACGPFYSIKSDEFAGVYCEGPEYGLMELGLLWEIDDTAAILKMNELFNQYGVDYFSAGSLMAWAMECYEKGILTKEDLDGTPLGFGDPESVIEMIPKIAQREGFGNILAEGEKRAPRLVGKGSEKYMYHVKGQSSDADEQRANQGWALQTMVSTRGACHLKGHFVQSGFLLADTDIGRECINPKIFSGYATKEIQRPEGMGPLVKWCEDMIQVVNSSGMCVRTGGSVQLIASAISSATGLDFTVEELLKTGERIYNVQKAFNARQGLTREDDNFSVPEKFTQDPIKDGPSRGGVVHRDVLLNEYYEARGWDVATGLQTREKLVWLGLEHVADELEKVNAVR